MAKSVAVLGVGRFGKNLALSLYDSGADVMVVDSDSKLIEQLSDHFNYAICADLTDPDTIKTLGLENMDIVVVATASDMIASIMSVMVAKEAGVKRVLAKASDERMGSILTRVGADEIIFPEEETGIRTAKRLLSDSFLEFFDVGDNLCLIEIKLRPEWVGKTLVELKLRDRYNINVVAIKDRNEMKATINPNKPLEEGTSMLIVVDKKDLKKIM